MRKNRNVLLYKESWCNILHCLILANTKQKEIILICYLQDKRVCRKTQIDSYSEILVLCLPLQVLYIQAFVLVFLLGKFMRKVFFGQLRAAEMEVHFWLLYLCSGDAYQIPTQ